MNLLKNNNLHKLSLTFIGMPGCGKSYLGKIFSQKYNFELIELDNVIENKYNKSLFDLIKIYGDENFSKIEEECILDINFNIKKIISTGGSVVYCKKGMEFLQQNNIIIHLDTEFEILKNRTNNFTNRGIVFNNLTPFELFDERNKLYRKYADISIKTNDININLLDNIINSLNK